MGRWTQRADTVSVGSAQYRQLDIYVPVEQNEVLHNFLSGNDD